MTGNTVLFRADASATIGGGHVRRCLALAEALAEAGWSVVVAASPETFAIMPGLARSGFQRIVLLPTQDEATQLRERLPQGCRLVVVDHYGRGIDFERGCRSWASQILVIDDFPRRAHDCDMLLDQTPGRSAAEYASWAPATCRVLAGADYALLDKRFRAARRTRGPVPAAPRRLLVSFGWSDPAGATAFALEALSRTAAAIPVDVVLGADSPSLDRVRQAMSALASPTQLLTGVDDMAALLLAADLAIGAGGVSALERCCAGLPSIIVPIADNQTANARALAERGAALVLPTVASLKPAELASALRELAADAPRRAAMSAAGTALCDGWGTERVAAQCLAIAGASTAGLVIRPALPEDARAVWAWRNDPGARAMSADAQPIAWETHCAWFDDRLASPDTVMLIGCLGDQPVGVLRFDRSGDTAEVSIAIAPERRGQGWGVRLLSEGCDAIERRRFAQLLEARIKPENTVSQRIFTAVGFRLETAGVVDRYRRLPKADGGSGPNPASQPSARKIG